MKRRITVEISKKKFYYYLFIFFISGLFPAVASLLGKMGISIFSRSSMDFFYNALRKIKDEHNKKSDVCLSLFHSSATASDFAEILMPHFVFLIRVG